MTDMGGIDSTTEDEGGEIIRHFNYEEEADISEDTSISSDYSYNKRYSLSSDGSMTGSNVSVIHQEHGDIPIPNTTPTLSLSGNNIVYNINNNNIGNNNNVNNLNNSSNSVTNRNGGGGGGVGRRSLYRLKSKVLGGLSPPSFRRGHSRDLSSSSGGEGTPTTTTTTTTTTNTNNNNTNEPHSPNRSLYHHFYRRHNHPPIQRTNSTILEKHLYKKSYFAREELHRLYNIFKKETISQIDFSEYLIFQGLAFLVSLHQGVETLTKLIIEYDEMIALEVKKQPVEALLDQEEQNVIRQQLSNIKNYDCYSGARLSDKEFSFINTSSLVMKWRASIDGITHLLFHYIRVKNDLSPTQMPAISQIIDLISKMTRGTIKEKSELVFKICKKKSTDCIYKSELLVLVRLVDSLSVLNDFGYGNIGTPEEIVNNVFKESYSAYNSIQRSQSASSNSLFKSGELQKDVNSSLTFDVFMKRANYNADISRGFGFFDLIYACFVKPVEVESNQTYSSYLYKVKHLGVFKYAYSLRFFSCRDGFLIAYKRLRLNKNVPSRVICLFNTSVKVLPKEHPDHHNYPSIIKSIFKTGTGNKEIDESKDATDFVLELYDKQQTFIALTSRKASLFVNAIRSNSKGSYRFHSYASPRDDIQTQFYINGADYFSRVYSAIKNARNEIFIAGWCISPELYLVRGDGLEGKDREKYRLDKLLLKKASEGVKVYILIWDETIIANDLGSRFVKSLFEKLHRRNIKVIRHPHTFPLYWSHHQKVVVTDQNLAFIGGIDLCYGRYENQYYLLKDTQGKMYPGADYINTSVLKPKSSEKNCVVDREKVPRLPWHDVSISMNGMAARDVAVNFIQRWNHAKNSNRDYKKYPYIIPTTVPVPPTNGTSKVQLVRSVGDWSAGQSLENSIYKAYINLINMAQHFIYIQNQFFISSTGTPQPNNQIAFAILKRIEKAILLKSTFRVIIVLPIHSEGDLYTQDTQLLAKWTLKSIQGIKNELQSLYPNVDVDQYLSVNSLRNWCVNNEILFTEQIYVHSKLMIVDDRVTIIGSANINDRSMNGSRDSEICAVIEDTEMIITRMDGVEHHAGIFALNLRCALWQGHLGLLNDPNIVIGDLKCNDIQQLIVDPISDLTYNGIWRRTALLNTIAYRETFGNLIPENCTKVSQYQRDSRVSKSVIETSHLREIVGFLIEFPFTMFTDESQDSSTFYSDILNGMKLLH